MTEPQEMSPRRFGKYVLLERIGRGGMAEVFRARTFGPGGFAKDCAIKRILPNLLDDEQFVRMFIDEARLTSHLAHPNIVQVLELGELQGSLFIAMEYIAGKDLLDVLARCARRSRRIPRELVLYIMMELLRALDYAHNALDERGEPIRIVHRDVSPSNVLVSYSGTVKIGDFGIARSGLQTNRTEAGTQKGKMGYMSPEQVTGAAIDRRSDLFAASVIFFEMLTMSRLFKAENDLEVMLKIRDCEIETDLERMSSLPDDLRAIVRKGLARDARERFQTAHEFYTAIARFVFKNEIDVSASNVEAFMRDMFADRIAEEMARRASDPGIDSASIPDESEAPSLRFRDDEGRIHGPMTHAMMEELLLSRPVAENERVSVRGGPWVCLTEVPTLVSIQGGRPRTVSSRADSSPVFQMPTSPGETPSAVLAYHSGGTVDSQSGLRDGRDASSERSAPITSGRMQGTGSSNRDVALESALSDSRPPRLGVPRSSGAADDMDDHAMEQFLQRAGIEARPVADTSVGGRERSGINSLLEAYLSDSEPVVSSAATSDRSRLGTHRAIVDTPFHMNTMMDVSGSAFDATIGLLSGPSQSPSVSSPRSVVDDSRNGSMFDTSEVSSPAIGKQRTADWEELSLAGMNPNRRRKRGYLNLNDSGAHSVASEHASSEGVVRQFGPSSMDGALGRLSVARLMYRIHSRGLTGLLQIQHQPWHKEIFFRDGIPVAVYSSVTEEMLGAILVRQGVLTAAKLQSLQERVEHHHGVLSDELVRNGLIAPHALFHHLSEQLREMLSNVLFTQDGTWRWWGGARQSADSTPIPVDLPGLINRTMLEYVSGPFCKRFFDGRSHVKVHRLIDTRDLTRVNLAPRALRLATMIERSDTVALILTRFTESHRWKEKEVYQLLFLLVEFEVIALTDEELTRLPGD
jgi:serine/threonine protein kinase